MGSWVVAGKLYLRVHARQRIGICFGCIRLICFAGLNRCAMRATPRLLAHKRVRPNKPLVTALATSVKYLVGRTSIDPKTLNPGIPPT